MKVFGYLEVTGQLEMSLKLETSCLNIFPLFTPEKQLIQKILFGCRNRRQKSKPFRALASVTKALSPTCCPEGAQHGFELLLDQLANPLHSLGDTSTTHSPEHNKNAIKTRKCLMN